MEDEADHSHVEINYDIGSSTISSKCIYQYDAKREGFCDRVTGKLMLPEHKKIAELEANMGEDRDENYMVSG